jgi:hypothetical protein
MRRALFISAIMFTGATALAWQIPVLDPEPTRNLVDMNLSATAPLAQVPDLSSQDGLIQVANWLISAAQSHDYVVVIGLLLVLLVAAARWVLPRLHDKVGAFFNSDHGKGLLVLILAEVGSVSSNLIAHKLSVNAIVDGVVIAFFAAGGYSVVKPILEKVFSKPSAPPPSNVVSIVKPPPIPPA